MIDTLDNDDYFNKKSELIKQKSLLELALVLDLFMNIKIRKNMNFLNGFMMKIKGNLKLNL